MKVNAAVVAETNQLSIETVILDPPRSGEILVQMRAAGVCHSDLHTLRGELAAVPPLVLGHEGAGVVVDVGSGVTRVRPGDRIMVNWLPACGVCDNCQRAQFTICQRYNATSYAGMMMDGTPRFRQIDGALLKHYLGVGTMAEHVVISQENAIPIPDDVPFEIAAITSCAVATGVGAVFNLPQSKAGSSAVVIGCGGVGLSMILGCQLAGCHPIVAVDVQKNKLDFARALGASDVVDVSRADSVVESIRNVTSGGADLVFDSVGSRMTIPQAVRAARAGGVIVIVGLHSALDEIAIKPADLIFENKQLIGSTVGSINPARDLPRLISLYRAGRLPLDRLIGRRYPLSQLSEAFEAMVSGQIGRNVIVFDGA